MTTLLSRNVYVTPLADNEATPVALLRYTIGLAVREVLVNFLCDLVWIVGRIVMCYRRETASVDKKSPCSSVSCSAY